VEAETLQPGNPHPKREPGALDRKPYNTAEPSARLESLPGRSRRPQRALLRPKPIFIEHILRYTAQPEFIQGPHSKHERQ
jgi:hypothetical protein